MPGFVFHAGAVLNCPHTGPASPVVPAPRVLVSGLPVATITDQFPAACPALQCVKVQWANVATRVLVNGQPVLLQAAPTGTGDGLCLTSTSGSQGPPVLSAMQPRVVGT